MTNETQPSFSFNPFPGLRAFEEEEEHLFFGREKQVSELLGKLSTHRFLAVIGASGSGKSSLVKSGLLPSLFRGFLAGAGSSWNIAVMRPGSDPIGNLADALSRLTDPMDEPETEQATRVILETDLRRSRLGLAETAGRMLHGKKENVLIVVDQFEELFRFSRYEKESNHGERDALAFVNLLLEAAQRPGLQLYVTITMRSDFLGSCTEFRGLPEAINQGLYLIPRMTREEIRSAITGPVAVGGGTITPMLVSRLLNDVGDNPDQLPILQHALMRTWQYHSKHAAPGVPLDISDYEAVGTMKHALSQHAEEAYAELSSDRGKELCELIFRSLTEKRPDMPGTRRPTSLADLAAIANAPEEDIVRVISVFRAPERSFLVPPHPAPLTSASVIDISHESLMRVWERLVHWVEEEAESAETYLRLVQAAALYRSGKGGLYRSPELDIALRWREQAHPNAAWGAKFNSAFEEAMQFLDRSEQARQDEEAEKLRKQKRKKRRTVFFAVTAFLLFYLVSTGVVYYVEEDMQKKSEQTMEEIEAARSRSLKASHLAENYRDSSRMLQASILALESYEQLRKAHPGNHFHPDEVNFLALDKIFWAEKQSRFNITENDTIRAVADISAKGEAAFLTQHELYHFRMDPQQGLTASSTPVPHSYELLAASAFDHCLAAGSCSGRVILFRKAGDRYLPEELSADTTGGAIVGLDFTAKGVLTTIRRSAQQLKVEQFDIAKGVKRHELRLPLEDSALVLLHHSRLLVAGKKEIRVYDHNGSPVKTITGIRDRITALAVSPDSDWVSWGTNTGDVYVHDLRSRPDTGRELPRMGHCTDISSLLFYEETKSTDTGTVPLLYLASGGRDGQVIILDVYDAVREEPEEDPLIIVSTFANVEEMEYNSGAYMLILKDGKSIAAHILSIEELVRQVRAIRDSLEKVVTPPRR